MKLSVIVPVFNEQRTIAIILDKVRAVPLEKEIIVVDGGSFDGTRDVLREEEQRPDTRVVYEPARRGRGRALKEGLAIATGEIVIFQDADLELDPSDYPALVAPLLAGEADVVFGSRFLQGRPLMTFMQYWGNRIVNVGVNLLYGTQLTDVETCYQVFRREAIAGMTLDNNDFAFTVELTVKLIKSGYRLREIPIKYIPRGRMEGKKIYWGDGFWAVWTLVKYRFMPLQMQPAPIAAPARQTRVLSEFYGIRLTLADDAEPALRAEYRGQSYAFALAEPGRVLQGEPPARLAALVGEWQALHGAELVANWERQGRGEPPVPIAPLE
jgi:glycosyltransferase involved in cell wall biosynthesis